MNKILLICFMSILFSCSEKQKIQKMVDDYEENEKETITFKPVAFEEEKKAYKDLATIVLNDSDKVELFKFIDTMSNYYLDDDYYSNLNFILEFIEVNNIPFLIRRNEEAGGFNSVDEVTFFMKKNYNIDIDISEAEEKYDRNDYNCLVESDRLLRKYAYQYGFIMTGEAENIIVIHKTSQMQEIKNIISRTGYEYSEM